MSDPCKPPIGAAAKVPLEMWEKTGHDGGIAIADPSDFYLGFMTPESKTADGVPRYGWYHLSIADDLSDITLLDSGVGLYGESVCVGIGAIPEPSCALLLLLGVAGLALKRKSGRERSDLPRPRRIRTDRSVRSPGGGQGLSPTDRVCPRRIGRVRCSSRIRPARRARASCRWSARRRSCATAST